LRGARKFEGTGTAQDFKMPIDKNKYGSAF
jgi:hypothetical protein